MRKRVISIFIIALIISVTTLVPQTAYAQVEVDLSITKTVDKPTPNVSNPITYTIVVNNPDRNDQATNVLVTDLLPAGITYTSHSTTQGTYNRITGQWSVGTIPTRSSATLTINAFVNYGTTCQTITNTASITSFDQTDPVTSNNSASVSITVQNICSDPALGCGGCSWNCTSNDVTMTRTWLGYGNGTELGPCTRGGNVTAYVWGEFNNHTGTARYAVWSCFELWMNSTFIQSVSQCEADTIPSGGYVSQILYGPITWECGYSVSLKNLIISWDTASGTTCADKPTCSSRQAKCYTSALIYVKGPVVADFTSNSPQCVGNVIQFTDTSFGGVPPYSYSWNFGDGIGTSTAQNPSYLYGAPGNYTVTLTITDSDSPPESHSTSKIVTVYGPITTITAPSYVCSQSIGNTAFVPSAGTGATYNWSVTGQGSLISGQNTNSITWDALSPGIATISVTVTDAHGCTASNSVNVTVRALPVATISAPSYVCALSPGNTASVPDAGMGASYYWTVTGQGTLIGGNNTSSITWDALGNGTATISVTVTDAYGCSASSSIGVTVRPLPDVTITAPSYVCTQSTNLTASVPNAGTGAYYNWSVTGQGILTGGNDTRSITWNSLGNGTATISVTVTDSYGCSDSNSVIVTVLGPDPTITAPSGVCAQSTGHSASVPDAGILATYNWSVTGNGILTSGQNSNLITWNALGNGTATISITITDSYGCSASSSVNVTIRPLPNVTITAPSYVCTQSMGHTASVPDAGAGASYTWSVTGQGTLIGGQGTRSITWNALSPGTATISVTVTDAYGCSNSNSVNVTIRALPSVSISTPSGVCAQSTGHNASVPDAGVGASYTWSVTGQGTLTGGQGTRSITWNALDPGTATISVIVTDGYGCSDSNSVNVIVRPLPSVAINAPSGVCAQSEDNTASVLNAGAGASYNWSVTGQGTITEGQGTNSIKWDALGNGTANISVTVTDGYGCSDSNNVNVTIRPLPSVAITAPLGVCAQSTDHNASVPDAGAGASYSWSVTGQGTLTEGQGTRSITWDALDPGTANISVTVTDGYGCSDSNSVNVTVRPLPSVAINAPSGVCAQSEDNTASVPDAGAGATYNWSVTGQGTLTNGQGTRSITWDALDPGTANISVTVTDGYGCSNSNSVNVVIRIRPDTTITSPSDVCTQSIGNNASVPSAGTGASYDWSITGQGTLTGGNNTRSITWNALGPGMVTISVTVTDVYGCADSNSTNVTVHGPDPTITAPSDVCAQSAGYTASVPNAGPGASYNWSVTGQGTIAGGQGTRAITWNALGPGTAIISVTITDAYGCTAFNSINATVHRPDTTITLPSYVCTQSTGNTASVPNAGAGATYNWSVTGQGTLTGGQGTRSITWNALSPGIATISVTITDAYGCTASNSVSVTVRARPNATITTLSDVCTQSTGNTASVPDAGAGASYNWSVTGQGTLTAGQNTRSITWSALNRGTATISVTVIDFYGCSASNSSNVTVHGPDSTITAPSGVDAQSTGHTASVPDAGSGASYNWTIMGQGTLVSGQNTRSITWNALDPGTATISVTVTDSYGCTSFNTRNVTVYSRPNVTTNPATYITSLSARLNGYLMGKGSASSVNVSFEWATHDHYTTYGDYDNETTPSWPMVSIGPYYWNLGGLNPETTYHFRAKAVGNGIAYGSDMLFTTFPLQPPNQPPNVYPIHGAVCVSLPVTFRSAPFSDPDPGDTHSASQWQIRAAEGSYTNPAFDSGTDTSHLINLTLTESELDWSADYYWRLRHQDSRGAWSQWSIETYFITADTPIGANVSLYRDGEYIHFTQVNAGGCTWVTKMDENPVKYLPYDINRVGPFVEITTTANYSGTVIVGLTYNGSGIMDEGCLVILHWNGKHWENVTTSVDANNNVVYGQVISFSPFALGYVKGGAGVGHYSLLQGLGLIEGLLDYFVDVSVRFDRGEDGQWQLADLSSQITDKGESVLNAIVTIIHNNLDFLAQFSTLLPYDPRFPPR